MKSEKQEFIAKVQGFHRDSAVISVSAAVRTFIEDNPDFNGPIKLHLVSFTPKNKEIIENGSADNDCIQKLIWDAIRLAALNHPVVQKKALKAIASISKSIKATFAISEVDAHIILERK